MPALAPLAVAIVVGVVWAAASWLGDHGQQLVNAGLWWWGWLVLPVAAAGLGAWARRRRRRLDTWLIGPLLVAPMAVVFMAHDIVTDRRPAYWPEGCVLLVVLALLCSVAASGPERWNEPG